MPPLLKIYPCSNAASSLATLRCCLLSPSRLHHLLPLPLRRASEVNTMDLLKLVIAAVSITYLAGVLATVMF
ncbi:hypothetical protein GUJ93_ZPchr0010g10740 [Zizania palustris]|uniref:Uncharacterized protein n=1 Tax=Zizania palustris TaxID=103762 RepID=A0A8J6BLY0_ZIZPA|nr:hypothetical protein GUJ93_ZPchr0010g10740 [Zizania palustris]